VPPPVTIIVVSIRAAAVMVVAVISVRIPIIRVTANIDADIGGGV
jgi:hypothetical protein